MALRRTALCLLIALAAAPPVAADVDAPAVGLLRVQAREGGREAAAIVEDLLAAEFAARGATVLRDSDLRPLLRKHRIRTIAGIDAEATRLLASETGMTHVCLVTVQDWSADPLPEVSLTARVLVPRWNVVASAAGAAATGDDHLGWFGTGRIRTPEELAAVLVPRLVADLELPSAPPAGFRPVAIVPLDATFTGAGAAAATAADWLAVALARAGVRILEPGDVRHTLLAHGRAPRGNVDDEGIVALADELGAGWILTGSVDSWRDMGGDADNGAPALTWGLRLVDAETKKIVAVFEREHDGHAAEGLFRTGRRRALGALALDAARDVAAAVWDAQRPQPDPEDWP